MCKNTIVIDCSEHINRAAVLEDGRLKDLIIEKADGGSIVGNIYSALVKNVLPARFAFIDTGHKNNAFLFLEDKKEDLRFCRKNRRLTVQVVKDPAGSKGAYVSTQLNFTGILCVLAVNKNNDSFSAVSGKIKDEAERLRLKEIATGLCRDGFGIIIRTSAEGVSREAIEEEAASLFALYNNIAEKEAHVKPPALLYSRGGFLEKAFMELYGKNTESVYVNSREAYKRLVECAAERSADTGIIKLYTNEKSLFEHFNIEKQIKKALNKKVWLDSGAFLFIEQTEAMTVIDVNSGKFEGRVDNEESMLKVNLEAAAEIAAQLRLRNLSGIVVIDFIGMKNDQNNQLLLETLHKECSKDRISVNIAGMTALGLVELTRKKAREPLLGILGAECPHCNAGRIQNPFITAVEILDELSAGASAGVKWRVRASCGVLDELKELLNTDSRASLKPNISMIPEDNKSGRYKIERLRR